MILEVKKSIELNASVERVWSAITDPQELARWFPDDHADFRAEDGYQGFFVWAQKESAEGGCGGGSFAVKVEKSEPPHLLVWSWAHDADTPLDETGTTRVEWKLSPRDGGGTLLQLHETGFENLKDRELNDGGWDHELGELVSYIDAVTSEPREARTA